MTINWNDWWKEQHLELPKKHPILLFEGCDASGKSTIQEIMKEIIRHAFIVHTSAPTKGNSKEYFYTVLDKLVELMDVMNQPLFFDRFHIGELVYGSIFRPETIDKVVEEKMYQLENELLKREVKMIYVTASPEVITKRIQKRGDWYVETSDIQVILDKYEEALQKSKLPIYRLDTTSDYTLNDIKNLVLYSYGLYE